MFILHNIYTCPFMSGNFLNLEQICDVASQLKGNKINYLKYSNKVITAMKFTTFKGNFTEKNILNSTRA